MGKRGINYLEKESGGYTEKKKTRSWNRGEPKDTRYNDVKEFLAVSDTEVAPPASVLHIVNRLPQRSGPAIGDPKGSDPLVKELNKHPDNVLGAIHDVLDKASSPEKEIKLPKNFFEKALADAKGETYNIVKRGLDLIRAMKYENKDIEIVRDKDQREVDFKILDKIKLVDPDNEKLLAEIKRLNNFEAKEYDINNLRRKIDSYADIIYLKISNEPESEKQKGYKERVREIMGHEVREIFRQNKDVGQALEVAIYLPIAVHKGLIKIVDQKEENANRFASPEKPNKGGKFMYRSGPTPETAAREPLSEESDEERLARLEEKIKSDEFSDAEREFFKIMVEKYPHELQVAKEKRKKGGGTVDENWAELVRTSYINDRKRAGLDKGRWGSNGPLAPEKAEVFEDYLELKLPVGLPPKKPGVGRNDTEEAKEKPFTPEQSSELFILTKEVAKIRELVETSELAEIIEEIIREKLIAPGIFSKDDFSVLQDHVTKWIQRLNDKK